MDGNPVIDRLGRRLRLAVVGGGPGSFIGAMHRTAARMDDRYELVAGVPSSDPNRSLAAAISYGIDTERAYPTAEEMFVAEAQRNDAVDVVAIMTPNDSHYRFIIEALGHGFDVICDKPMTNTLAEARGVVEKVNETGLVFGLTHNYTGYPLVRQARAMVQQGELGVVRLVQVEYVQGGKADEIDPDPQGPLPWRYDPTLGGPSLVMGDIGTHAHNLLRFIAGREVVEVAADVGHVVPGRLADDYGGALLRLDNGGRGIFWVTQTAAGVENCLRIRVSGTLASLEWSQETPTRLIFKPVSGPARIYTPNGEGNHPSAVRATRLVAGHPEGFPGAFANIYADVAEAVAARRSGLAADPLSTDYPNHVDGLAGVAFVEAAVASSTGGGMWTAVPT